MGIMYEAKAVPKGGTRMMLTWTGVFVICGLAVALSVVGLLIIK